MCKCKSEFFLYDCSPAAWCVLPVQKRVRAVGGHVTCVLSHAGWGHRVLSAAILLHAGRQLVSQGELLYAHGQTKEYVSKCEIHKVSRLGLQERKLNSLELLQVLRWERIHFFLLNKKGQNKLYWFLLSNYTHVRETVSEVWKKNPELNLQVLLSFLYHPLELFSSNKSWVTNLVIICQWIVQNCLSTSLIILPPQLKLVACGDSREGVGLLHII